MRTTTSKVICICIVFVSLLTSTAVADLYLVQQGSTNNDTLLHYDLNSNTLSSVGSIGFGDVRGLAYDHTTNTLFGVSRQVSGSPGVPPRLISIDPNTGVGSLVTGNALLPVGSNTAELSVSQTGGLVGLGRIGSLATNNTIVDINKSTGVGTAVNSGGITTTSVSGLAFDHSTGTLYSSSYFGILSTIDPNTGIETQLGSMSSQVARIVFDQDTGLMYGITSSSNPTLEIIDPGSLATTNVYNFGSTSQIYAIASVSGRSIPEPICGSLMAGFCVAMLLRRRRPM